MHSKKTQDEPEKRSKLLNLIFFIDSEKTRSLKIEVRYLYTAVLAGIIILAWAIGSVFLLADVLTEKSQTAIRLKNALRVVFEYQTKHDQIFENAYPGNQPPQPDSIKVDAPVANVASSVNVVGKTTEAIVSAVKKGDSYGETRNLKIEDLKYEVHRNAIDIEFVIKNPKEDAKAEGYVWAILESEPAGGGQRRSMALPAKITLDNLGAVKNPRSGESFSIKRFRAQKFTFSGLDLSKMRPLGIRVGYVFREETEKHEIQKQIEYTRSEH